MKYNFLDNFVQALHLKSFYSPVNHNLSVDETNKMDIFEVAHLSFSFHKLNVSNFQTVAEPF